MFLPVQIDFSALAERTLTPSRYHRQAREFLIAIHTCCFACVKFDCKRNPFCQKFPRERIHQVNSTRQPRATPFLPPNFETLLRHPAYHPILKLGIAQRQIRLKSGQNLRKWQISSPTSIKTVGDLIRVKRRAINLTRYHLATRMGIAAALVRSWEGGKSQPDSQQLKALASLLGVDAGFNTVTFPHV
jgi:ribosome-binding protein aMBF1 (putative translation factor)